MFNTIHVLCCQYLQEEKNFKKDIILKQIFNKYKPLVCSISRKLVRNDLDFDDIQQHVHLGIVCGITTKQQNETFRTAIFRRVRAEVYNKLIRPRTSQGTSLNKDVLIEDYLSKDYDVEAIEETHVINEIPDSKIYWTEDASIMRIDIERAINSLPAFQKNIVLLWMRGYSCKEIKSMLEWKRASIFATIINYHLQRSFLHIRHQLCGYEMGA